MTTLGPDGNQKVELRINHILVIKQHQPSDNLTQQFHIDVKSMGGKYQTLWHSLVQEPLA